MILKCCVVLFILQVLTVELSLSMNRHLFSLNLKENRTSKFSPLDVLNSQNYGGSNAKRKKRCLGTALTLLWPQVVGPVEQGIIKEEGYNVVPKTLLEHRLESIRKKAKEEEENRLLIRDYLKKLTEANDEFYGVPAYGNSLMGGFT